MSVFVECLNEMREHHKKNILNRRKSRYLPSKKFEHFFVDSAKVVRHEVEDEALSGLQRYSQSLGREQAHQTETTISSSVQKLKDNNVSAEAQVNFRMEMEKRRKVDQEKAVENINKIYDEAIKIGEQHPETQGKILMLVDIVSNCFNELCSRIVNFVTSVLDSIVEWVKRAWETINSTFNAIGNWVSGWF